MKALTKNVAIALRTTQDSSLGPGRSAPTRATGTARRNAATTTPPKRSIALTLGPGANSMRAPTSRVGTGERGGVVRRAGVCSAPRRTVVIARSTNSSPRAWSDTIANPNLGTATTRTRPSAISNPRQVRPISTARGNTRTSSRAIDHRGAASAVFLHTSTTPPATARIARLPPKCDQSRVAAPTSCATARISAPARIGTSSASGRSRSTWAVRESNCRFTVPRVVACENGR